MEPTFSIMFVDDELHVLEGIRRTLSKTIPDRWGLSFFQSGIGALREIERRQPDVLITDKNLPGMSGKMLLDIVHNRFPCVQTFILSGQCSEQEARDLVRSKEHHFCKPLDCGVLLNVLGPIEAAQAELLTQALI